MIESNEDRERKRLEHENRRLRSMLDAANANVREQTQRAESAEHRLQLAMDERAGAMKTLLELRTLLNGMFAEMREHTNSVRTEIRTESASLLHTFTPEQRRVAEAYAEGAELVLKAASTLYARMQKVVQEHTA